MKKFIYLPLAIIIALFGMNTMANHSLPTPNATQMKPLNGIAAIVNDDIITQSQFNHAMMAARQQLTQSNIPVPDATTLKKQVMDQLIYQHLQLQIAKRNNIEATNKQINAAMARIAEQNKIPVTELKTKLAQEGISYHTFRSQISKQIIISQLQHQAVSNITVNKKDIAAFREQHKTELSPMQYHVANLLVPSKTKAKQLMEKLRTNGHHFDQLMQNYPGSGDLGWRNLNDLPTLFSDAIKKTKPGAVAGPLHAANGYHIIKLLGTRNKGGGPTDAQVQNILMQQKFQKALQKWLQQLRRSAYIHINVTMQ